MLKQHSYRLVLSGLIVGLLTIQNASAALVTATFEGMFIWDDSTPGLRIFDVYRDSGQLPFSMPAPGTPFRVEVTYDPNAPLSLTTNPRANTDTYLMDAQSLSFEFGSYAYSHTTNNVVAVTNDSYIDGINSYFDQWAAVHEVSDPATPDIVTNYGVSYNALFPTAPGGPLAGLDASVPMSGNWYQASIFYQVIDYSTYNPANPTDIFAQPTVSYVRAVITDVSVTPAAVPVPAAAWLFGSAILGTIAMRRAEHK